MKQPLNIVIEINLDMLDNKKLVQAIRKSIELVLGLFSYTYASGRYSDTTTLTYVKIKEIDNA